MWSAFHCVYCGHLPCADATNEYVEGQDSEPCSGIYSRGLHCVTVLIGVFDKTTSLPIIGELCTVSAHAIIHIHCLYRHVRIYS